jgi:hypothetical protein
MWHMGPCNQATCVLDPSKWHFVFFCDLSLELSPGPSCIISVIIWGIREFVAMTSSEVDISQLSESQQLALEQYTAVTNQELEAAIPLLQRSQWNLQVRIYTLSSVFTIADTKHRLQSQNSLMENKRILLQKQ